MKEGVVKKVKQDDTRTDGVQKHHTNCMDKANSDTKSVEAERYVFATWTQNLAPWTIHN